MAAKSFSDDHGFKKPNDERALQVMDTAAKRVMEQFTDIVLAFGESDEFRSVILSVIHPKSDVVSSAFCFEDRQICTAVENPKFLRR